MVLALAAAYLIGAIPFGYLLVKWTTGRDVRSSGSGNIGATNVLRTTGRAAGVATLLLDIAKGYLAVWLAGRLTAQDVNTMTLAALAVMAGHAFPVFLRFKGGKAVASFTGAYLCLTPLPMFAVLIVLTVTVAATRFISLGSILAAGAFPFAVWLISHPPGIVVAAAAVSGGFIVYRHRENMARLRAGNENVFSFGGRKK
ncbi:MAG: glycerol-3-phosphate 1-O-acyltransferase PlsY [Acidobacteria bacterium]|nr:glycerol-3-phosphate 1-O-acyltransferase PlsY [Acidobacteriota bacterium]MBI3473634.1 glycerol-3-phosphate 1-O-acyltransferase PlsY [Candidatus Solibacter usitatus]